MSLALFEIVYSVIKYIKCEIFLRYYHTVYISIFQITCSVKGKFKSEDKAKLPEAFPLYVKIMYNER